ncbi:Dhcr24, partial [Symbiodinium necroappetens]
MKPLPAMRFRHALLLIWSVAWATMPRSAFTTTKRSANLPAPAPCVSPTTHGLRRPHPAATKLFLSGFSLGLVAYAAGSHRLRRQKFCTSSARQSVGTSLDPSFGLKQDQKGRRLGTSRLTGFEEFMAQLVGAPEGPVQLDEADYRAHVFDAQEQMKALAKSSEPFTLDQSGNAGSIYGIGRREYQKQHGRLNLSRLRGIIDFDSAARTVTTGAKTDFKTLTRFLLDRGFIVPVVPEVDTVTVGGAISGIVMEAASFRHGFVHNTVQSMEVLLPDGSVVLCSREDNAELFNAIPHSYGTFGYVLSATMLVVPAETEVMVRVQELPTPRDAVDGIAKAARDPAVDFVEGIIFGQDRALTMTASMCAPESLESNLSTVVLPDDGRYIDVVCRHLDESRANWHSKNVSCSFRMSTFDFLYRWDCDIFWATRRTNFLGVPAVREALGRACLRSKVLWPVGTFLRGTK